MAYTTDLLNPVWWVDSLFGNWILFVAIIEIWLLGYIRRIPNVKTITMVLLSINVLILIYSIFGEAGASIGTGLIALAMFIMAYILWKGEESK
jgi:hypothetical protein